MKPLYLVTAISTGLLFITGCTHTINHPPAATIKNTSQNTQRVKNTNPLKVSFYTHDTPKIPYTVIGEESISKFNQGGIKRQEAHLRESMRELAAAMGGDAVINIKSDSQSISGTVVAFEKESQHTFMSEKTKNQS